jgi:hypothetical protein
MMLRSYVRSSDTVIYCPLNIKKYIAKALVREGEIYPSICKEAVNASLQTHTKKGRKLNKADIQVLILY